MCHRVAHVKLARGNAVQAVAIDRIGHVEFWQHPIVLLGN